MDNDEKILKSKGWKIHSKQEGKKFWESPHDHRVYSTSHAVIAQQAAEDEVHKKERAHALLNEDPGAANFEKYQNWEIDLDKLIPLPRKKKKEKRRTKVQNLKDLGF